MLAQQLEQKLQQKLSPAQIQVIKLVGATALELEELIKQEIEENPALEESENENCDSGQETEESGEEDEDFDKENKEETEEETSYEADYDKSSDYDEFEDADYEFDAGSDIPDYRLQINNSSADDKHEVIPFSVGKTFHEYLTEQISFLDLTELQRSIVLYIIGNIDEEGYLRRMPDVITDDLLFQTGIEISTKEVEVLIKRMQNLEPAGVCARNLQECLLLQLERKKETPAIKCAKKILSLHFISFSKKHYNKIQRSLNIDDQILKTAIAEIVKLNPKPGSAFDEGNSSTKAMATIIPDFILENNDGKLAVHLNNSNIPELHISATYNEMLKDYRTNKNNQTRTMKDALIFVKQKVESAQYFIDAVKQRQHTLLVTMTAIVNMQKDFFIEGDESYLKPLILKDIADVTGLDVSTISRVSNSKYIQTEFGIFPVKYFFSEAVTSDSGEEVSIREIKKIIQECIDNEDKQKPMNDDLLTEMIKQRGYSIARRTIAKYREQLNIPVGRLRIKL